MGAGAADQVAVRYDMQFEIAEFDGPHGCALPGCEAALTEANADEGDLTAVEEDEKGRTGPIRAPPWPVLRRLVLRT
jgi:hypothetical protein